MGLKAGKYHKGAQIFNGGTPKFAPAKQSGNLKAGKYHESGVDFDHMGPEGHDPMGAHRVAGHKPKMPSQC